jgi:outer membrane lipoprotein SlyB
MSSVTRFIKQIPAGSMYYTNPNLVGMTLYKLVPASGNVVGSYPPGHVEVVSAPGAVHASIQSLYTSLNSGTLVLRDMGKTIQAPVGSLTSVNVGFFRQVQILLPASSNTVVGGLGGSNFGVVATPAIDSNTSYMTVYVSVPLGGVYAGVSVASGLTQLAGGSM